jgi:flagellar hook-associated protein 1 FlgK
MASKAEQSSVREKDSGALAAELEARISADSGVNLDEELANMILFQNAYAASARMIAAARDLFDILLQLSG